MVGALSRDASAGDPPPLGVVCWRGRTSINILVSKGECKQMLDAFKAANAETLVPRAEAPATLAGASQMQEA